MTMRSISMAYIDNELNLVADLKRIKKKLSIDDVTNHVSSAWGGGRLSTTYFSCIKIYVGGK